MNKLKKFTTELRKAFWLTTKREAITVFVPYWTIWFAAGGGWGSLIAATAFLTTVTFRLPGGRSGGVYFTTNSDLSKVRTVVMRLGDVIEDKTSNYAEEVNP